MKNKRSTQRSFPGRLMLEDWLALPGFARRDMIHRAERELLHCHACAPANNAGGIAPAAPTMRSNASGAFGSVRCRIPARCGGNSHACTASPSCAGRSARHIKTL
jgi:hypothetical protein